MNTYQQKRVNGELAGSPSHVETGIIRIFLVDDNCAFLAVASRYLSLFPHFRVVGSAASAEVAIGEIERLQPDLVIMDVLMPGMNGLEATRHVKKLNVATAVIMTSFMDDQEFRRSAEGVADGFIPKEEFGARIAQDIESLFG